MNKNQMKNSFKINNLKYYKRQECWISMEKNSEIKDTCKKSKKLQI